MPGIAAIICWEAGAPEAEGAERIKQMRGPGARVEIAAGGFRMAAYAIAPGDAAPMGSVFHDAERGLAVAADARLDNRAELIRALGLPSSDGVGVARLLALGYERWGDALPEKLVGDFSFIIWNERDRTLLLARDPFGVRPLFYVGSGATLWIASEPDRVLAGAGDRFEPDSLIIHDYLAESPTQPSATPYQGVNRALPGHIVQAGAPWFDDATTMQHRWWHPPAERPPFARREELIEEFRSRLSDSIDARLDPALLSVAELSGGIDSPAIARHAEALCAGRPDSRPSLSLISGVCPGLACDESEWIAQVAATTRFPSLRWDATQSQWRGAPLAAINYPQAEPQFGGYAGYYDLLDQAGARIILSGVGGDQLLFDRPAIADLIRRGRLGKFRSEVAAWNDWSPKASGYIHREALRLAAPARLLDLSRRLRGIAASTPKPHWMSPELLKLALEWGADHAKVDLVHCHSLSQRATWESLTKPRLIWNIEGLQLEAMRLGREVRFPYLDRRLVEFVLSLSPLDRLPGGWNKRLLREAASPGLPREVAWRRESTTYEALVAHQGRANLAAIRAILLEGEWLSGPYIIREEARKILNCLESGAPDPYPWLRFRTLWAIAKLEDWLRSGGGFFPGKI